MTNHLLSSRTRFTIQFPAKDEPVTVAGTVATAPSTLACSGRKTTTEPKGSADFPLPAKAARSAGSNTEARTLASLLDNDFPIASASEIESAEGVVPEGDEVVAVGLDGWGGSSVQPPSITARQPAPINTVTRDLKTAGARNADPSLANFPQLLPLLAGAAQWGKRGTHATIGWALLALRHWVRVGASTGRGAQSGDSAPWSGGVWGDSAAS